MYQRELFIPSIENPIAGPPRIPLAFCQSVSIDAKALINPLKHAFLEEMQRVARNTTVDPEQFLAIAQRITGKPYDREAIIALKGDYVAYSGRLQDIATECLLPLGRVFICNFFGTTVQSREFEFKLEDGRLSDRPSGAQLYLFPGIVRHTDHDISELLHRNLGFYDLEYAVHDTATFYQIVRGGMRPEAQPIATMLKSAANLPDPEKYERFLRSLAIAQKHSFLAATFDVRYYVDTAEPSAIPADRRAEWVLVKPDSPLERALRREGAAYINADITGLAVRTLCAKLSATIQGAHMLVNSSDYRAACALTLEAVLFNRMLMERFTVIPNIANYEGLSAKWLGDSIKIKWGQNLFDLTAQQSKQTVSSPNDPDVFYLRFAHRMIDLFTQLYTENFRISLSLPKEAPPPVDEKRHRHTLDREPRADPC